MPGPGVVRQRRRGAADCAGVSLGLQPSPAPQCLELPDPGGVCRGVSQVLLRYAPQHLRHAQDRRTPSPDTLISLGTENGGRSVTPSRWFAGGRGLDEFRQEMLADRRLRSLVDFPDSRDVFPGVDIAGGISYFFWDSSWKGKCKVTTISGSVVGLTLSRYLDDYDILVRYNEAVSIL